MQIRAGYEIEYECPQPTPKLLVLSIHPSRFRRPLDAACDPVRSADPVERTTRTASATSARASSRRPGG